MATFLNAVASVTIILLLTATGWFCGHKGWMTTETKGFISRLLLRLAVPCMCIYGLQNNLTRDMLSDSLRMLAVPFVCNTVNFLASYLLTKLLRIPKRRAGVFMVMCSLSNAMFIGYAMCLELFGEPCVPYVMIYYIASTCFTQTVAMWLIRRSAEQGQTSWREQLKFLTSPTVLAVIAGFTLVVLDVHLPAFVLSYLRYMNNIVSPLALLLTGFIIYEMGWDKLRLNRDLAVVLVYRFLISPALYVICCAALNIQGLARATLIVEASMPVVTQTVVAASQYGADEQFAAEGAALSTLASFVVIPVLMLLL